MEEYPSASETHLGALLLPHDPAEVEFLRKELSELPCRTPRTLLNLGRKFVSRFGIPNVTFVYEAGAVDCFYHTKRLVQLGTPELQRLLHEIGHAKFGRSEHMAVYYSVGLILKAIPNFQADFDNHKLTNDPWTN